MPSRLPTRVKELRGTLEASRSNPNEPQPEPAAYEPPDWLTDDAKAIWQTRASRLIDLGILCETDTDAFGIYSQALADYQRLTRLIREQGETVETVSKRGTIIQKNPLCTIANEKWEQIKTLSSRFGLSPVDRSKVEAKPPHQPDLLEQIIGKQ